MYFKVRDEYQKNIKIHKLFINKNFANLQKRFIYLNKNKIQLKISTIHFIYFFVFEPIEKLISTQLCLDQQKNLLALSLLIFSQKFYFYFYQKIGLIYSLNWNLNRLKNLQISLWLSHRSIENPFSNPFGCHLNPESMEKRH